MNRYSFLVLWYQPALGNERGRQPFAVVVEGRDDNELEIFCIGKYLPGNGVLHQVIQAFPSVLREKVHEVFDSLRPGERIVDKLRALFAWNIYAQEPEVKDSPLDLKRVAYELFAEYVDVDAEELDSIRHDPDDGIQPQFRVRLNVAAA